MEKPVGPLICTIICPSAGSSKAGAPRREATGCVVAKSVQWMTLQELRDELERTRTAWETMDLDGVIPEGQLPSWGEQAHRHQLVANELLRRPSND